MAVDKKVAKPASAKKAPVAASGAKKTSKKATLPLAAKRLLAHPTTRPLWSRIRKTAKRKNVEPASLLKRKASRVEKPIGGDKNGGKRLVRVKKQRSFYPTEAPIKKRKTGHVAYKNHRRTYKAGIEPGRVVIVLAGRHKGKRVVVLKTLPSGLLLVTGPHIINGCPVRRMHQMFTIVTSTKLDISKVKIPEAINDKYFKRVRTDNKKKQSKKTEGGDIFETKAEQFKPNEQRKKDQVEVDKQLVEIIRKSADKKLLFSYLGSFFQLRNHQFPHKLKF
jgi:large subunit ribosomal protein L6e